jgi:hypothetical protein
MWAKQVWLMTVQEADLFDTVQNLGSCQNITVNFPNAHMSSQLVQKMLNKGLGSLIPVVFEGCPLLLAAIPADLVTRDARYQPHDFRSSTSLRIIGTKKTEVIHVKVMTDRYPLEMICSARGTLFEMHTCKIN